MSAVIVQGSGQADITVTGNIIRTEEYAVEITGDVAGLAVADNAVLGALLFVNDANVGGVVSGNTSRDSSTSAVVAVSYDGAMSLAIRGNWIDDPAGNGIWLLAASSGGPEGIEISDNTIRGANGEVTTNTTDAIRVTAGEAFIHGNKLIPRASAPLTRYGVNLDTGSFCCRVVGNDLGDPSDYGTDAYVDNGTDNENEWPADATYGDNFSFCPTSP